MNRIFNKLILIFFIIIADPGLGQNFTIARVHYDGGGDWYSDPSSLPNLLNFIAANTNIAVDHYEPRVRLTDDELARNSYLYLTGHGNIHFSEEESLNLREFLLRGGFLHADDNYGMDLSFRREMKRVFPEKDWVELPRDHAIYSAFFDLPGGLPKVHEHDGLPPQGLALFEGKRMIVFYSYESDLGDGWEDGDVHNDPEEIRIKALKMGANIVTYFLTQ
ncbi:MAG: DUF4159 domain-containing protein [Candidatus Neomarinimicrobiota bacterium]